MKSSCLLVLLGLLALGGAASDKWSVLPIFGGGYVQNVLICPSNPQVWYTYVDVGGPYRSDDAGRHWKPLHGNLAGVHRDVAGDCVRTMDVDPRNENSFVMCSGGGFSSPSGIFVSRDGGESFRKTWNARFCGNGPRRPLGLVLARNPFDPDELLAVEDWDGVAHSKDNGETWCVTGLEHLYVTDIRFDRNVKGRVYACALPPPGNRAGDAGGLTVDGRTYGKGFFRSDDSGETWRKLSDVAPNEVCQIKGDVALIGYFAKDVLKRSMDGGESWQPYAEGLPTWERTKPGLVRGNFLALAAGSDFYLAGDQTGTIYRRGLGESAWTKVETIEKSAGNPPCEPRLQYMLKHPMDALCTLVVDPRDANHWLATDWYEIWESTDAGAHWTTRIDGIMQLVSFTVEADPFNERNLIYGVADMGLFASEDGGNRWWVPNGWVYACSASYSRKTPKLAMMCGGKGPGMVKRSRSSGRWWEVPALRGLPKLDGTNPGVRAYTIAANPSAEEFLILLSGPVGPDRGGIYRTKNAGDDWEWYGEGLPKGKDLFKEHEWGAGGPYPQLFFGCDGSAVCYSAKVWKAWYLDKEKGVWGEVKGACGIMAPDPHVPGRFLKAGRPVLESLDGGRTFHPFAACTLSQASNLSFDAHVPGLVVAGLADRSAAVSYDGGVHFAPIPGADKVPSGCSSKILVDRGRLFYLTTGSGVYTRTVSQDGGCVRPAGR
ncbi:MAG: hypothetical protein KBT68_00030 [bacterium]|nr:hypothetical protein [Candidatus Colisoma equi]